MERFLQLKRTILASAAVLTLGMGSAGAASVTHTLFTLEPNGFTSTFIGDGFITYDGSNIVDFEFNVTEINSPILAGFPVFTLPSFDESDLTGASIGVPLVINAAILRSDAPAIRF